MTQVSKVSVKQPEKNERLGWRAIAWKWITRGLLLPFMPFIGVYLAARWIYRGGAKFVWDDFGSYIFGVYSVDSRTRQILWMRGVSYPEIIHFHPMVWTAVAFAVIQRFAGVQLEVLGLLYFFTFLLCLITVFTDLPIKTFLKWAAIVIMVVPLADYGLAQLAVWGDGLLTANQWPGLFAFLERGVLRPLKDALLDLDATMSTGMLVLWGIGWSLFLVRPVVLAWLDGRFEMDAKELITRKFFQSDHRDPIYFLGCTLTLSDVMEVAFGFADLKISLNPTRAVELRNVFGLAWWGRRAFNDLVNNKTLSERDGSATTDPAALGDDGSQFVGVRPADEELGTGDGIVDSLQTTHADHS